MSKKISKSISKGSRKGVLAYGVILCIASLAIAITILAAIAPQVEAEERAVVAVNAPAVVEIGERFVARIDVDNVTDLNSGQFDLSFDPSVVNVTAVKDGEIEGEVVSAFKWQFVDYDTVRVLVRMPMGVGVTGSGYLAEVKFEVKGEIGDKSALALSRGLLVDMEAKKINAEWMDDKVTLGLIIFDTGAGTFPSISGTHEGIIIPAIDIVVHKMYTYPSIGTGGHSVYVRIWNDELELNESATWDGFIGDWHNIVFCEPFTLYAGKTYNFIIKTGSYPQIHHTDVLNVAGGTIKCKGFTDANGHAHENWIPAIKLW